MTRFPASPVALEVCATAAKSADATLRAAGAWAAGRVDTDAGRDTVLAAWADADDGVKCAALDAMPLSEAIAHLAEAAASKSWRVRAQAVETALAWRTPECIDTLIALVADEVPRVCWAAVRALRFLSDKEIAPDAELWRAWWQANKAGWHAKEGRPVDAAEKPVDPKSTRAHFQGVEIDSDRVAFVIDHSTSMTSAMKSGGTRAEAVHAELRRTLEGIPDGFRANLVLFGKGVHACFPKAKPLGPKIRETIFAFADKSELEPATNLAGGILEALADDGIDTVFVLTDGTPSCGDFVSGFRVRVGISRANRTRKIAIHTIGFGVTDQPSRDFLKDLAAENGGRCVFR
jgi:hypothetical protein